MRQKGREAKGGGGKRTLRMFRARAVVTADGRMTLPAPAYIPPGEMEVTVTLPAAAESRPAAEHSGRDRVLVIETNIDDMNPEVYGYLIERLLAAGAKDAYLTPIVMKKGRPGVMVSALADEADADRICGILMAETTTLGVRLSGAERKKLGRRTDRVTTPFGPIGMKVAEGEGILRAAPEYEDCARAARERGIPILEVYAAAQRAWEEKGNEQ